LTQLNSFDMACPIDSRYYGADSQFFERLKPYVSEEAYIRYQGQIEIALAEVLVEWGKAPPTLIKEIKEACQKITAKEVYQEEERIGHIVRAFVNCIRNRISEESRPFVHLFATSNDVTDTATTLRFKELTRDILLPDLISLEKVLISLARKHADSIQIGRTHGKHAEPITFGFAMANYVARLGNRLESIDKARKNLRGKFSGAVGGYNALSLIHPNDPEIFEMEILSKLGLKPTDTQISTQIVHPEYITDLVHSVVSTFSVIANLADDIRHLHRSEIAETQEIYSKEQVGSSTMPHKLNPKNFEFVKSMWKAFMPRMMTVYMDQISEHQRDLTNSASGRFVSELFTGFIYSVHRLTAALKRLHVDVEAMQRNLKSTNCEEILAEPLYIVLSLNGHPDGHKATQELIAEARATKTSLAELIWKKEDIRSYLKNLSPEQRLILEQPYKYTGATKQRTTATCDFWEMVCDSIKEALIAETKSSRYEEGKQEGRAYSESSAIGF